MRVELVFHVIQGLTAEEKDLLRAVGSLQKRVSITVSGATEEQIALLRSMSTDRPWVSDALSCHSR